MIDIHFMCTGGTIDKIYFDANSKYEVGSPAVKWLLDELPNNINAQVTSVMAKDSLEMTDDDRQLLTEAIAQASQTLIVVTHGTDTMADTAEYLSAQDSLAGKVIVLTGALSPAIFRRSDAEFNLGSAIAAVQCQPAGVYLAVSGEVYNAGRVRKNVAEQRFERI